MFRKIYLWGLCLFFSCSLMAMDSNNMTEEAKRKLQEEVDEAVKAAKESLGEFDVKEFIRNFKKQQQKEKKAEYEKLIDDIKDQNTILFGHKSPVAFYKGDIVRGSCFAVNLISETIVYKIIQNRRFEHICESLKSEAKNLEEILTKVNEAKKEYEKKLKNRTLFQKMFGFNKPVNPAIKLLTDHVNSKHNYINYNPFKLELLLPLISNLVIEKATDSIEKKFVKSMFCEEAYNAYKIKDDGTLTRSRRVPFSAITLLKLAFHPRGFYKDTFSDIGERSLRFANKMFKLGIPDVIFSDTANYISYILSTGLAVKLFDKSLHSVWLKYITENSEELLELIKQYNQICTNVTIDLKLKKDLEEKLKKFVIDGHKTTSILPLSSLRSWLALKHAAISNVSSIKTLPIVGIIAWKGYKYYKENLA